MAMHAPAPPWRIPITPPVQQSIIALHQQTQNLIKAVYWDALQALIKTQVPEPQIPTLNPNLFVRAKSPVAGTTNYVPPTLPQSPLHPSTHAITPSSPRKLTAPNSPTSSPKTSQTPETSPTQHSSKQTQPSPKKSTPLPSKPNQSTPQLQPHPEEKGKRINNPSEFKKERSPILEKRRPIVEKRNPFRDSDGDEVPPRIRRDIRKFED